MDLNGVIGEPFLKRDVQQNPTSWSEILAQEFIFYKRPSD
jgi:hypothetical protein